MNKEIQQEAERRYPIIKVKTNSDNEFTKLITRAANSSKIDKQEAFISGATFAQQKQDERMIEFAEWIEKESWKANYAEQKTLSTRDLLTIFKAEKGY